MYRIHEVSTGVFASRRHIEDTTRDERAARLLAEITRYDESGLLANVRELPAGVPVRFPANPIYDGAAAADVERISDAR